MSDLDLKCLVGELGDMLLSDLLYQRSFNKLDVEEVNYPDISVYYRLIGIPVVVDAFLLTRESLLTITKEGRLMIIDNNHPRGFIVDLDTPPIKRVWNSRPLSFLDIDNTLHFINLGSIIRNIFEDYLIRDFTINNPQIRNVEWIIHSGDRGGITNSLTIKYPGGLIDDDPLSIAKGKYESQDISMYSNIQKISNCYSFYSNGIREVTDGDRSVQISDDVIDVMYSNSLFYTINSRDQLQTISADRISNPVKEPDFSPTRLIKSRTSDIVYVEDSGGNIYDAKQVINEEIPISLNLPVILNGFKQRGGNTKSARNVPKIKQ